MPSRSKKKNGLDRISENLPRISYCHDGGIIPAASKKAPAKAMRIINIRSRLSLRASIYNAAQ